MLLSQVVVRLAIPALLLVSGTPVLTQQGQPTNQEVVVTSNPVYPTDAKGVLIPWKTLLSRDKELYELSSKCEDVGLDPEATNYEDAKITGYPSYGILQFQPKTFLDNVKRYNALPGATDKQILAAVKDPYLQIFIARRMISAGEGHQWSCYSTLKLSTKYPVWKTKSEDVLKSSS